MADLEGNKFPDDLTHHTTPIGADAILIHDSVANETKYTLLSEMTTSGSNGLGVTGQGDYVDEAALIADKGPLQAGWVYYDETSMKSLLRNATNDAWVTLAESVVATGEDIGSAVYIRVDFQTTANYFLYTVPAYMILNSQESEGLDATLLPPLSTSMAPYTKLKITPASIGLITLIGTIISPFDDTTPPEVTFVVPSTWTTVTVPITTFTATDEHGVKGYMVITDNATPPTASTAGWLLSPPTTITVAGDGSYTFYAWAKDTAGNVSIETTQPCTVTVTQTNVLKLTWDAISSAQTWLTASGQGSKDLKTSWDGLFGVTFTDLTISGNDVLLEGGSNITIATYMFTSCATLKTIDDPGGMIVALGVNAFLDCTLLSTINLAGVVTVAESSFENTAASSIVLPACTSITGPNVIKNSICTTFVAVSCTTVPDFAFNLAMSLTNVDLRACTALGTDTGNNSVFNSIANNTVVLTVPIALETNNAGGPDGDIVSLLANNPSSPAVTYIS